MNIVGQSGFRALPYINDNSLPLHDVDHITMGFFEMVIEFLQKTIQVKSGRASNSIFEILNNRLIQISSCCLIGERKFNHGAFDFPRNQWKIIRTLMRDLPFACNNLLEDADLEARIVTLLVCCNKMLDSIDLCEPWTESRIKRFEELACRYPVILSSANNQNSTGLH